MAAQPTVTIDPAEVEGFVERVVVDLAGTMASAFCALGDRLGLFTALAEGPATSGGLAARAGVDARYVSEWARGLAAAGYLDYDEASDTITLPPAHIPVLADEGGEAFFAGGHQFVRELLAKIDEVEAAFRSGGGVALDSYPAGFWEATERFTGPTFEHQLIRDWIPAVPGLRERLEAGARVADIGTGTGLGPIRLAQAFPNTTVHGIDIHAPNIARAADSARAAGVADRVTFEHRDGTAGLPDVYDVVTIFLVVHDSDDPLALLKAARAAVADDGILLIQEINCGETVEANAGPIGTMLYGFSLFHCMTQSLASGGAGLGSCGLPESRLRALALDAGFSSVERAWEGPTDALYAVRP